MKPLRPILTVLFFLFALAIPAFAGETQLWTANPSGANYDPGTHTISLTGIPSIAYLGDPTGDGVFIGAPSGLSGSIQVDSSGHFVSGALQISGSIPDTGYSGTLLALNLTSASYNDHPGSIQDTITAVGTISGGALKDHPDFSGGQAYLYLTAISVQRGGAPLAQIDWAQPFTSSGLPGFISSAPQ